MGLGLFGKKDKSSPAAPPQHTADTPAIQPDKKELSYYRHRASEHFKKNLPSGSFNGGIVIAKNGTVVYEKYSGFADLRKKDSLNAKTSLHLASVSKTFTAMAVLHLSEAGKLSLDDSLGKFFTGFPYAGITVKMLLSQRSGLPNYLNYLSQLKKYDTVYTNQDVLNSLYSLLPPLEHRPGTRFNYSNTNYVLLAMVIEKVTGESFPDFIKKTFFDPLEMYNTFVYTNVNAASASPSFKGNGRFWMPDQFDITYGDKNIYSTPQDMLKWDQALYSGKLFKKETLDMAFSPLSNERPSVHNYGLGWRMLNLSNGKKVIYHNGRWHGTNSAFVRLMDEKATIIVIGNKYNRNIYLAAKKAYDIFGEYLQSRSQHNDTENTEGGAFVAKKKALVKAKKPFKTKR